MLQGPVPSLGDAQRCPALPPIAERWHGKMLCESKEKSQQLEILLPESRWPGHPGPLASADSRSPGQSHDLSFDSGWSVFSIKCPEVCHTWLGWDNLAKPVLVPFSGLDCKAFCFPVENFLMKNSEIQILPGLSWWYSYPSTFIHSFIQQNVLKHSQRILIMMAY